MLPVNGNFRNLKNSKYNLKTAWTVEVIFFLFFFFQYNVKKKDLEVEVKPNLTGTVELLAMIKKPGVRLYQLVFLAC